MKTPRLPIDYPDRHLECQEALESRVIAIIDEGKAAGWSTRGIKIAGKNPKGNLTAKFATRKDIFSHNKDTGLWSLTEWDQAETKEAPAEESESASKPEDGKARNLDSLL